MITILFSNSYKLLSIFYSIFWLHIYMNLEKLFWSRTKTDILKYLVFRRQGISVRAFETELTWSFPAIKKQIDQLEEAGIIDVKKDNNRRSIYLVTWIDEYIKNIFLYTLKFDLAKYFTGLDKDIDKYFLWKLFWNEFDMDLVIVHEATAKEKIPQIKEEITHIFEKFLILTVNVVFMSATEFQKRNRLADKFVLALMASGKPQPEEG